jgi:DNA (cytosine-5)-methyltransferase 1
VGRLKVMDLFCGTGGFGKGFERTGAFEVVYGIDLLPTSVATFRLNHPDAVAVAGDIRRQSRRAVADRLGLYRDAVDVVIGGPPCQGFSSIRPHRSTNFEDPRNTLFEEFAAYVGQWRPRALVFENVVGLATHRGGADLAAVQAEFDALGYDTDWRILNAANFGVPQKRERLILLGVQRGIPLVWPRPTHAGAFRTIGHRERDRLLRPAVDDALPPAPSVLDAIGDLPPVAAGERVTEYAGPPRTDYQQDRRGTTDELTLHQATRHGRRMLEIIRHAGPNISCIPPHLISSGFSSCYSRLAADEPAPTITVNFVHPASNKCIHPLQDRALTPREGARLQSFDDDFRFAGDNRNAVAKQIGNAVPPLLGEVLGRAVAASLGVPA